MDPYSEDLRKIVEAVERGTPKTEAARSFGASRSSVKRYAAMAREGGSLAPKKRPGSEPKLDEGAKRLLEADLERRPAATLPERREYLKQVAGAQVSESTVSRMLKRMGWSRKKVGGATERDEVLRAAWRALVAAKAEAGRFVFMDEVGANASLSPIYAWSRKGERARGKHRAFDRGRS